MGPNMEGLSDNWDMRNSTSIDRSRKNPNAKRVVPMRLLCMSFPRTATMSTVAALEKLGFNGVYHGIRLLENPPDINVWRKAIQAKTKGTIDKDFTRQDWDALLGHVEATTDFPSILFPEELIKTYPEAKVILNVRNTEAWWKSAKSTVFKKGYSSGPFSGLFDILLFWFAPFASMWLRIIYDTIYLWKLKGTDPDVTVPPIYDNHNKLVQQLVPPERLLLWGPQDGWEPLCKFLDLPIPNEPVPHINETKVIQRNIRNLIHRELKVVFLRLSIFVGVVCIALSQLGYITLRLPFGL